MHIHDRRVRRTQKSLVNALIALSLEKGYDAVTIRDITEAAEIGYATFFRHYPDKDALLHDVLDGILSELMDLLACTTRVEQKPETVGIPLFRYVQEHSDAIRVLLSSRGSSPLVQQALDARVALTLEQNREQPVGVVPADVAAYHLIASSLSLIQWWLEHDFPYTPEQMGRIYQVLVLDPPFTPL